MWTPGMGSGTNWRRRGCQLVATVWLLALARAAEHLTKPEDAVLKDLVPGGEPRVHPDPPKVPDWILNYENHFEYTRYSLTSPEYIKWIREEMVPVNQQYEELAYARDWEPFMNGTNLAHHETETVLVTTSSPERLPFVRRMLHHWQGPMALAIFIPNPAGSAQAAECRARLVSYVLDMMKTTDTPFAVSFVYNNYHSLISHCNVTTESTGLEPAWADEEAVKKAAQGKNYLNIHDTLWPGNHVREVAFQAVQSNAFLLLIDGDFVPSGKPGSMYSRLRNDTMLTRIRSLWETKREREVIIIPAFERLNKHEKGGPSPCEPDTDECWLYEHLHVPYTKRKLVTMVGMGYLESFCRSVWEPAYGCYLAEERWLKEDEAYEATVTPECEPYIIGLRDSMPRYDLRFRGHQMDKVSFLQHVTMLGHRYVVHPDHFVVHLPHNRAVSLDDPVTERPAVYDKWTVVRVMESVAYQEKTTVIALDALLKGGVPLSRATHQARAIGEMYARELTRYRLSQLPPMTHAARLKSRKFRVEAE